MAPTKITRRDFLNGVAIGTAGLLTSNQLFAASPNNATYYPPLLTGMRGSHEGSFEVAHELAWAGHKPKTYQSTHEHYDLTIVGAGMSGLAAAHFYRQKMGADAKILLLDNHDDFGGHAKRNEFDVGGQMRLGIGGAQNLEIPSAYSDVSKGLLKDLGIDTGAMATNVTEPHPLTGHFSTKNTMAIKTEKGHVSINANWMMLMRGQGDYESLVESLPFDAAEKTKLINFFGGKQDFLSGLSLAEKYDYIYSVSYNEFLRDKVGLNPQSIEMITGVQVMFYALTGWDISVAEAFFGGAPGMNSIGWVGSMLNSVANSLTGDLEVRMFPDGNASVARLLVQKLIPNVAPNMKGFEDVAVQRFDYSALDNPDQPIRLRLNSTVVGVRENSNRVEVDYVQNREAKRVTADRCVLACYNNLIPHLCPELPAEQKEALNYGTKIPLVYTNVLIKNGRAMNQLGTNFIQCPGEPFVAISSSPSTVTGSYQPPQNEDESMVLFLQSSPTPAPEAGESIMQTIRRGRHLVYATSFASYEEQIRTQLQSVLGPYGFNHEEDILAITVNRWPHGYAYTYLSLHDPEWEEGQAPHEIGRKQFGRISIANSDSEASAYLNAAVDAAWRAVEEQT